MELATARKPFTSQPAVFTSAAGSVPIAEVAVAVVKREDGLAAGLSVAVTRNARGDGTGHGATPKKPTPVAATFLRVFRAARPPAGFNRGTSAKFTSTTPGGNRTCNLRIRRRPWPRPKTARFLRERARF
jgi:hypothetical protein